MAQPNSILDVIQEALESQREALQDAADYWRALAIEPEGSLKAIVAIDAAHAWLKQVREAVGLEAILHEVVEWQRIQFPHRSAASIAKHLLEEAQELQREPTNEMEMADVLLLLVALADFNAVNLAEVARCKLAINKARVWGKPDEHGVVKHVDTPAPASPQAD